MRSLGEFFGHIVKGATTDPAHPPQRKRTVLRHDVQEEIRDTPEGKVTLRRTTIEEVELDKSAAAKSPSGSQPPSQP